jgi:Ca-activated chloride channel family protein
MTGLLATLTAGLLALPSALQGSLFGQRVRVVDPLWLWASPLVLALGIVFLARVILRHERARALIPDARHSQLVPGAGRSQGALRASAMTLGLLLLCFAAAGPQCGERTEIVKRTGIDLVIALDASASMLARDVKPSRLERARLELFAMLDQLKGDRVGLVVFAGEAFVQCPLTVDYSAAKLFLRAVDPSQMPQQGTAVAAALLESRRVLEGGGRSGAAKVVLLLSDGEDHEGAADKAAQEFAEAGIKLYTVAVGTEAGEPIPVLDKGGAVTGYRKDRAGQTVLTRTDVAGLQALAEKGGGALLRGGNGGDLGLSKMVEELDRMQRGDLESRLSVQYDDKHQWFAWPALLLLSLAAALGEGKLRWRRS